MTTDQGRAEHDLVEKYRLPGECDNCATEAAALATGYDPTWGGGLNGPCTNPECRFYDADHAAHMKALDEPVAVEPAVEHGPNCTEEHGCVCW